MLEVGGTVKQVNCFVFAHEFCYMTTYNYKARKLDTKKIACTTNAIIAVLTHMCLNKLGRKNHTILLKKNQSHDIFFKIPKLV